MNGRPILCVNLFCVHLRTGIQLSGQQRRPSIGLESLHRANLILEQRARETIHFARPDLLGLVSLPRMSSFFPSISFVYSIFLFLFASIFFVSDLFKIRTVAVVVVVSGRLLFPSVQYFSNQIRTDIIYQSASRREIFCSRFDQLVNMEW